MTRSNEYVKSVWKVAIHCLIWISVCRGESLKDYEDISKWYTRYAEYPPYCSTQSNMNERNVPPLTTSMKTKLLHATTIIRHGQRTPYRVVDCWDSFWEAGEDTAVWNCELNTMMSPPAPPQIHAAENDPQKVNNDPELAGEGAMFLFEKRYDGLPPPLKNQMNGTCQVGQLLLRGYVQELTNGHILRNAYLKSDDSTADQDDRLTLFDATKATTDEERASFYQSPNFYYRADDDQRTLMSGQALLRGLFHPILPNKNDKEKDDPVIVLHTADRDIDILAPNHAVCPRLNEIRKEALLTEEFQNYNNSISVLKIRQMMEQTLGKNFEYDAVDCLMTTICTDRKLPNMLNDYHNKNGVESNDFAQRYGNNRFERLAELSAKSFIFPFSYNDGLYSKLAMGPLWDYILKNIMPFSSSSAATTPQGPKMALFSGHDTTIMPILATLGGDVWNGIDWTPYASMLIIEVHEILEDDENVSTMFPTKRAFRLLYNGQILTNKVDGCAADSELCDLSILLKRVQPFATAEPDCQPRSKTDDDTEWHTTIDEKTQKNNKDAHNHETSSRSFWAPIIISYFVCALSSSIGTFYFVTKRMPFCFSKRSLYKEAKSLPDQPYSKNNNTRHSHLEIDHAVEVTKISMIT
jgi:hypothetical protein